MCGRGGRDRDSARAHIFYSTKQQKMDTSIKDFCTSNENCRRKSLLKAVGSTESVISSDNPCCDVCNPDVPDHIVCLQAAAPSIRKQRRRRVRNVSYDQEVQMTEALMRKRDIYIDSHPS